jgi:WD40 repeat protein
MTNYLLSPIGFGSPVNKHSPVRWILIPMLLSLVASEARAQKPPTLAELKYAKNLVYAPDGSFVLIDYRTSPELAKNIGLGVWDTKTGEFRINMEKSTRHWDRIAVSADGKKAAAINMAARELKVWDVATGKLLDGQSLPKLNGLVPMFLMFTPDGDCLYSTLDKQIIEAKLGAKYRLLPGTFDFESPALLSFNAGTKQLLSISNFQLPKAELRIYNLAKEGEQPQLIPLTGHVRSMAISHDGKTLAMSYQCYSGKPRLELRDTDGWKLRATLSVDQRKGFSHYAMLSFAPDDKTLAGAPVFDPRTDKDVDFFDLDGKIHHEFTNKSFVNWLIFSPDGKTLALKLLDLKDSILFIDSVTGAVKKE